MREQSMKVVVFGATGMIGQGVLLECLEDPGIESVLAVVRRSCKNEHPKFQELLHDDFFDYSAIENDLSDCDACFFCLGVSSAGMGEAKYSRLTYELTLTAAETLARVNPEMTFCYVSGAGTDSTEGGRVMWARIKGKTENALLKLPFKSAYMFRPGFIQPLKGIKSSTRLYRLLYTVTAPLSPLFRILVPNLFTTTEKLGLAMIAVARNGYESPIIEGRDIRTIAP
jgi:uncharacterized protein YbjT (DUF2867 family)